MAEPDFTGQRTPTPGPSSTAVDRRERARLIAVAVIAAVVAVFAVINLNSVEVHWLVTTNHAPLILVVVLAFLLGGAADRLLVVRARRRSKDN